MFLFVLCVVSLSVLFGCSDVCVLLLFVFVVFLICLFCVCFALDFFREHFNCVCLLLFCVAWVLFLFGMCVVCVLLCFVCF